jgi:CO/xanthine dehydrogenase FAD-binding subunit
MSGLEFITANSKAEALAVLDRRGGEVVVLAGGTTLMGKLAHQEQTPAAILHVGRLMDLRNIEKDKGLRIGALVTLREIATGPELTRYASLREAARLAGGWQSQNVGTVGGNICNATENADLVPPLLVHGAMVELESQKTGIRSIPLSQFVAERLRTPRSFGELVVAVTLDPVRERTADTFIKVGRRSAMELSIASIAVRLTLAEEGRVEDVRIAAGAFAMAPFRANDAESYLRGKALTDGAIAEAATLILSAASPVSDVAATAEYRRMVVPRVFGRAVRDCAKVASKAPH